MARFYNLSDNYIVGNPATANQIYGSGGIASYLNDCTIAQLQRVLPPQADRLEVVIQSRLTEYFNWIKGESARFQEQVDQQNATRANQQQSILDTIDQDVGEKFKLNSDKNLDELQNLVIQGAKLPELKDENFELETCIPMGELDRVIRVREEYTLIQEKLKLLYLMIDQNNPQHVEKYFAMINKLVFEVIDKKNNYWYFSYHWVTETFQLMDTVFLISELGNNRNYLIQTLSEQKYSLKNRDSQHKDPSFDIRMSNLRRIYYWMYLQQYEQLTPQAQTTLVYWFITKPQSSIFFNDLYDEFVRNNLQLSLEQYKKVGPEFHKLDTVTRYIRKRNYPGDHFAKDLSLIVKNVYYKKYGKDCLFRKIWFDEVWSNPDVSIHYWNQSEQVESDLVVVHVMFTIFGLNLFKQAYSAHYQEGKDLLLFLEYYVYNPLCMTRNEASELVAQQQQYIESAASEQISSAVQFDLFQTVTSEFFIMLVWKQQIDAKYRLLKQFFDKSEISEYRIFAQKFRDYLDQSNETVRALNEACGLS